MSKNPSFLIKIYSANYYSTTGLVYGSGSIVFKKTLSPALISSGYQFANEINNGFGDFSFDYNSDNFTDIVIGDIVKVYKWSKLIYTWRVTNKDVNIQTWGIRQNIDVKGIQTVLNDYYFYDLKRAFTARYFFSGDANDAMANNNHGTATNVSYKWSLIGWCGVFNGTSSKVSIPHSASLTFWNQWNIWFRFTLNNVNNWQWFVSKTASNIPAPFDSSTLWWKLVFVVGNWSIYQSLTSNTSLVANEEYSACLIRSNTQIKIYINGKLDATANITTTLWDTGQTIQLWSRNDWATWLNGELSDVVFDLSTTWSDDMCMMYHNWFKQLTYTADPSDMIKEILGRANKELSLLPTDYTAINSYWSNISIEFNGERCNYALKKVIDTVNYYLAWLPDWSARFRPYPSTASHVLTFADHILSMVYAENIDEIQTNSILNYSTWSIRIRNTATAKSYGIKWNWIDDTSVIDYNTANSYRNNYINENSKIKDTIRIDINNNYDTTSIVPGDMLTVNNSPIDIKNKVIQRVEFGEYTTSVYLNQKDTIEKTLYNLQS